jgi:hypothetical protein
VSKLTKQLNSLKDHPQAGWVSSDTKDRGREVLMAAIGGDRPQVVEVENQEGVASYYGWNAIRMFTRPVTAGALVFVLLFGGWFTTAHAASASLPGDTLYGLKLVTERAQLAVSSTERRAVLHTEFAQRRLEEVAVLQSRGDSVLVSQAMEAFRDELQGAQEELLILREDGNVETIAIASVIDQKVGDLNDSLTSLEGAEETIDDVDESKKVAREVSDSAVGTIVDAHEAGETEESKLALEQSFKNEYIALVSRQTFDAGRIAVIEQALKNVDDPSTVLNGNDLRSMNFEVDSATDSVARAMDLAASDGYRSAFEILREADEILLNLEAQIAEIEFAILNPELDEEESIDETEENESVEVYEIKDEPTDEAQQVEVEINDNGELEIKLKDESIE